jgi:hypothetical protein
MILPRPLCPIPDHQIPLQPSRLYGPACQVGDRDEASSQWHEQGGWPGIEHTVVTMIYSRKTVVSYPAPFQMVDMLMVLLKTTTSAPSSTLSFSPHSFLTTPHTPDSPNGQCELPKLYIVHTFSALPIAFLGCFKATITYMSFITHIFLSPSFISAHFQTLTIYIHLLFGGYWLSSCSLSRI